MEAYVERMQIELDQLNERIEKLSVFIKSPNFYKADDIDRQLLRIQLNAMKTYSEALSTRFNRHKDE